MNNEKNDKCMEKSVFVSKKNFLMKYEELLKIKEKDLFL